MSRQDPVAIKGARDGLSLVIDQSAALDEVLGRLREKLANSPRNFFAGAKLRLQPGVRRLTNEEVEQLSQAVADYGMALAESGEGTVALGEEKSKEGLPEERTLYLKRTLRSGQSVEFDGHVVVIGDVNPGAVITCAGDIVVLGALRGVAHAGARGDGKAMVMAFRLEPTQLRIAEFISRAPDGKAPRPDGPEWAVVQDGVIQVRAYRP